VEVILDKSQRTDKYSSATFLYDSGILTNSFNFTRAAEENNAENLLVIRDKTLAEQYIKNWQEHEKHSKIYTGRSQ
jgi:phosphatidylserine/phosphatidylglycerophosphate/cardiolipin synthase-like enzyme